MVVHILIPDNLHERCVDLIRKSEGVTLQAPGKMNREDTLAAVGNADAMIIRSGTTADVELFDAAPNLKVITRAGVGVDNIDLAEATRRGVVVMNTPDGNTVSTAEHAFALMLAMCRSLPQAHQSLVEGRWDRKAFMGSELKGKTLGIVGFGRIGQALAVRAIAFGMDVLVYDVGDMARTAAQIGVELVDLGTLYRRSDFISLHPALNEETRGMINKGALEAMKRGVRIINAARGALIVAEDLAAAIQSGQVAGAALDVYEPEPPDPDNPLLGLEKVIHTPHIAASTLDAQEAVALDAANQTLDALTMGEYRNVVNREVLTQIQ
ncbi:MAG: hydroxyacid dehydrogenase [Anaerolineae bacterium]